MRKIGETLKIGDYFLVGIHCLGILLSFFVFQVLPEQGRFATVSVDGKEIYRLSLSESREIVVHGPLGESVIHVENGSVWIVNAPCPQKICMRMGKIHRAGEIIVCIPNRILIRIEGEDNRDLDGITM